MELAHKSIYSQLRISWCKNKHICSRQIHLHCLVLVEVQLYRILQLTKLSLTLLSTREINENSDWLKCNELLIDAYKV